VKRTKDGIPIESTCATRAAKEKKSPISCGTCNFSWLLSLDFWSTQWVTAKNHMLLFPVKGLIVGPAKS